MKKAGIPNLDKKSKFSGFKKNQPKYGPVMIVKNHIGTFKDY